MIGLRLCGIHSTNENVSAGILHARQVVGKRAPARVVRRPTVTGVAIEVIVIASGGRFKYGAVIIQPKFHRKNSRAGLRSNRVNDLHQAAPDTPLDPVHQTPTSGRTRDPIVDGGLDHDVTSDFLPE